MSSKTEIRGAIHSAIDNDLAIAVASSDEERAAAVDVLRELEEEETSLYIALYDDGGERDPASWNVRAARADMKVVKSKIVVVRQIING